MKTLIYVVNFSDSKEVLFSTPEKRKSYLEGFLDSDELVTLEKNKTVFCGGSWVEIYETVLDP